MKEHLQLGLKTTTLHNHKEAMLIFEELLKKHVSILSVETDKEEKDIKKFLQESTILTAEKAKEIGLVHEILEKFFLTKQTQ